MNAEQQIVLSIATVILIAAVVYLFCIWKWVKEERAKDAVTRTIRKGQDERL